MSISEPVKKQITDLIQGSDVVLFMKGSRQFPQCGFSSQVVQILDSTGIPYTTVNVLTDPQIRDGIKEFSSWPTIPQLYVKQEFVGGCDIVKELNASGELRKVLGLGEEPPLDKLPTIRLTEGAVKAIKEASEGGDPNEYLRFEISPQFSYGLSFGPKQASDVEVEASGIKILMTKATAKKADDTSISFVDGEGGGFKITNPNEPARVKQITAPELKQMMDKGEDFELWDVRTDIERAKATLGGRHLDQAGRDELETKDRNKPLVFHCHHGGRSQAAAEHYLKKGFKNVMNLRGGIDAWSSMVDPKIARY